VFYAIDDPPDPATVAAEAAAAAAADAAEAGADADSAAEAAAADADGPKAEQEQQQQGEEKGGGAKQQQDEAAAGEEGAPAVARPQRAARPQLSVASSGIRLLLVHQNGKNPWTSPVGRTVANKDGWGMMCGKVTRNDGRSAAATAAREVQEESHGLLPAAAVAPLLETAAAVWWPGGKMLLYLVQLRGAEELPRRFEAAVAGEGAVFRVAFVGDGCVSSRSVRAPQCDF
jgi:hypothetical protein